MEICIFPALVQIRQGSPGRCRALGGGVEGPQGFPMNRVAGRDRSQPSRKWRVGRKVD